ncbi:MAG: ferredoxin [Pseudomonadota bacterium]
MTEVSDRIDALLAPHGLINMGHCTPERGDPVPSDTATVVLLGPHPQAFWPIFTASPEALDGSADPMDRWSRRVTTGIAKSLNAAALFPFEGPPYQPFQRWALRSGRAWVSPVGFLVHDQAGLWVSFRGALALTEPLDTASTQARPCETCQSQPCRSACPVNAPQQSTYDTVACHAHLETAAGGDCLTQGCRARRICPLSERHGRNPLQSAFHMEAFHPCRHSS